jgi:hypothetical protein
MNDAQRYRRNAGECLSAAERCQPPYRRLTFTITAYWLALERHQLALDALIASGGTLPSPSSGMIEGAR